MEARSLIRHIIKPCEILLLRDGSLHAGVGSHPSAHTFLLLRIVISEQVKHLQGLHKEPSGQSWVGRTSLPFYLGSGLVRKALWCCHESCKPKNSTLVLQLRVFSNHAAKLWKSAAHHHVLELKDFLSIKVSPLAVCLNLFRSYPSRRSDPIPVSLYRHSHTIIPPVLSPPHTGHLLMKFRVDEDVSEKPRW